MSTVTRKDGAEIYYKDWGPKNAQPLMFHHGWPLSSDDWDAQIWQADPFTALTDRARRCRRV